MSTFKELVRNVGRKIVRAVSFVQTVAVVTIAAFVLSSVIGPVAYAMNAPVPGATQKIKESLSSFQLPYSIGRITDAKYLGSKKVVVAIQDLHCHPEVQRNIAKILGILDGKFSTNPVSSNFKVFVEGGVGAVDTSWVNKVSDAKVRAGAVESLMNSGRLTGSEYYAIKTGKYNFLQGLEDAKPYYDNLARLNEIMDKRGEIAVKFPEIKQALGKVKALYYTAGNIRLDQIVAKHEARAMGTAKYYKLLLKLADKENIDRYYYPATAGLLEIMAMQHQLRYSSINKELVKFISSLKEKVPFGVYNQLMEKAASPDGIEELYVTLAQVGAGMDLSQYPALAKFFAFVEKNQKMNPLDLVREEGAMISELRGRLSQSRAEEEVAFIADFLKYVQAYYENKMSADDYAYYTKNAMKFQQLWTRYSQANLLPSLDQYNALFAKFYGVNIDRNRIFMEKIGATAAATQKPALESNSVDENIFLMNTQLSLADSDSEVEVVVTGGFHTQGLSKMLEEKGISYVVITPNATGDTAYAAKMYDICAREFAVSGEAKAPQKVSRALQADAVNGSSENALALPELSSQFATMDALEIIQHTQVKALQSAAVAAAVAGKNAASVVSALTANDQINTLYASIEEKDGAVVFTFKNGAKLSVTIDQKAEITVVKPAAESEESSSRLLLTSTVKYLSDQASSSGDAREKASFEMFKKDLQYSFSGLSFGGKLNFIKWMWRAVTIEDPAYKQALNSEEERNAFVREHAGQIKDQALTRQQKLQKELIAAEIRAKELTRARSSISKWSLARILWSVVLYGGAGYGFFNYSLIPQGIWIALTVCFCVDILISSKNIRNLMHLTYNLKATPGYRLLLDPVAVAVEVANTLTPVQPVDQEKIISQRLLLPSTVDILEQLANTQGSKMADSFAIFKSNLDRTFWTLSFSEQINFSRWLWKAMKIESYSLKNDPDQFLARHGDASEDITQARIMAITVMKVMQNIFFAAAIGLAVQSVAVLMLHYWQPFYIMLCCLAILVISKFYAYDLVHYFFDLLVPPDYRLLLNHNGGSAQSTRNGSSALEQFVTRTKTFNISGDDAFVVLHEIEGKTYIRVGNRIIVTDRTGINNVGPGLTGQNAFDMDMLRGTEALLGNPALQRFFGEDLPQSVDQLGALPPGFRTATGLSELGRMIEPRYSPQEIDDAAKYITEHSLISLAEKGMGDAAFITYLNAVMIISATGANWAEFRKAMLELMVFSSVRSQIDACTVSPAMMAKMSEMYKFFSKNKLGYPELLMAFLPDVSSIIKTTADGIEPTMTAAGKFVKQDIVNDASAPATIAKQAALNEMYAANISLDDMRRLVGAVVPMAGDGSRMHLFNMNKLFGPIIPVLKGQEKALAAYFSSLGIENALWMDDQGRAFVSVGLLVLSRNPGAIAVGGLPTVRELEGFFKGNPFPVQDVVLTLKDGKPDLSATPMVGGHGRTFQVGGLSLESVRALVGSGRVARHNQGDDLGDRKNETGAVLAWQVARGVTPMSVLALAQIVKANAADLQGYIDVGKEVTIDGKKVKSFIDGVAVFENGSTEDILASFKAGSDRVNAIAAEAGSLKGSARKQKLMEAIVAYRALMALAKSRTFVVGTDAPALIVAVTTMAGGVLLDFENETTFMESSQHPDQITLRYKVGEADQEFICTKAEYWATSPRNFNTNNFALDPLAVAANRSKAAKQLYHLFLVYAAQNAANPAVVLASRKEFEGKIKKILDGISPAEWAARSLALERLQIVVQGVPCENKKGVIKINMMAQNMASFESLLALSGVTAEDINLSQLNKKLAALLAATAEDRNKLLQELGLSMGKAAGITNQRIVVVVVDPFAFTQLKESEDIGSLAATADVILGKDYFDPALAYNLPDLQAANGIWWAREQALPMGIISLKTSDAFTRICATARDKKDERAKAAVQAVRELVYQQDFGRIYGWSQACDARPTEDPIDLLLGKPIVAAAASWFANDWYKRTVAWWLEPLLSFGLPLLASQVFNIALSDGMFRIAFAVAAGTIFLVPHLLRTLNSAEKGAIATVTVLTIATGLLFSPVLLSWWTVAGLVAVGIGTVVHFRINRGTSVTEVNVPVVGKKLSSKESWQLIAAGLTSLVALFGGVTPVRGAGLLAPMAHGENGSNSIGIMTTIGMSLGILGGGMDGRALGIKGFGGWLFGGLESLVVLAVYLGTGGNIVIPGVFFIVMGLLVGARSGSFLAGAFRIVLGFATVGLLSLDFTFNGGQVSMILLPALGLVAGFNTINTPRLKTAPHEVVPQDLAPSAKSTVDLLGGREMKENAARLPVVDRRSSPPAKVIDRPYLSDRTFTTTYNTLARKFHSTLSPEILLKVYKGFHDSAQSANAAQAYYSAYFTNEFNAQKNSSPILPGSNREGEIANGLDTQELATARERIARDSDAVRDGNPAAVEAVVAACKAIDAMSLDTLPAGTRGALQNILNDPRKGITWMITRVYGKEKYILGHERGLAVDIILAILAVPDEGQRNKLLQEYILHEVLESMDIPGYTGDMKHNYIIRLTQALLYPDVLPQPAPNDPRYRELYGDAPIVLRNGQTALGKFLRAFIDEKATVWEGQTVVHQDVFTSAVAHLIRWGVLSPKEGLALGPKTLRGDVIMHAVIDRMSAAQPQSRYPWITAGPVARVISDRNSATAAATAESAIAAATTDANERGADVVLFLPQLDVLNYFGSGYTEIQIMAENSVPMHGFTKVVTTTNGSVTVVVYADEQRHDINTGLAVVKNLAGNAPKMGELNPIFKDRSVLGTQFSAIERDVFVVDSEEIMNGAGLNGLNGRRSLQVVTAAAMAAATTAQRNQYPAPDYVSTGDSIIDFQAMDSLSQKKKTVYLRARPTNFAPVEITAAHLESFSTSGPSLIDGIQKQFPNLDTLLLHFDEPTLTALRAGDVQTKTRLRVLAQYAHAQGLKVLFDLKIGSEKELTDQAGVLRDLLGNNAGALNLDGAWVTLDKSINTVVSGQIVDKLGAVVRSVRHNAWIGVDGNIDAKKLAENNMTSAVDIDVAQNLFDLPSLRHNSWVRLNLKGQEINETTLKAILLDASMVGLGIELYSMMMKKKGVAHSMQEIWTSQIAGMINRQKQTPAEHFTVGRANGLALRGSNLQKAQTAFEGAAAKNFLQSMRPIQSAETMPKEVFNALFAAVDFRQLLVVLPTDFQVRVTAIAFRVQEDKTTPSENQALMMEIAGFIQGVWEQDILRQNAESTDLSDLTPAFNGMFVAAQVQGKVFGAAQDGAVIPADIAAMAERVDALARANKPYYEVQQEALRVMNELMDIINRTGTAATLPFAISLFLKLLPLYADRIMKSDGQKVVTEVAPQLIRDLLGAA